MTPISSLACDVERDAMAAALSVVTRAMVRADSRSELSGKIELAVTPSGAVLHACDYRIDARATMPATVGAPGAILIAGDHLRTFIGKTRKGSVLSLSTGVEVMRVPVADKQGKVTYPEKSCDVLKIRCGRTHAALLAEDIVSYPVREPVPEEADAIAVSGSELAALLRTAQPAMLRDMKDAREMLMGVRVVPGAARLQAIATDVKRLHMAACEAVAPASATPATLPVDAIETLALIAESAGGETVRLAVTRHAATLRTGGVTCTAPLIIHEYPDVERVFPAVGTVVTVSAADLAVTIDRVGTVITDPKYGIRLRVEPISGSMIVSTLDRSTHATAEEWIDVDATGPAEGLFNHKFLLTALEQFGDSQVALRFATDTTQALTLTDPTPGDRRFLIMPMR